MLIHKATMGVLDFIWTGEYHKESSSIHRTPKYRMVTLAEMETPDDWWEIPSSGILARKIRAYYPWITPEIDQNGALIDVRIQPDTLKQATDKEKLREEAAKRGYRQPNRLRPRGIMPFLNSIQKGCESNVRQENRYRPVSG